jgi:hypothetical protein
MKRIFLVAIPLAVSQMGATDCGQIIKDPGFDLWCGDRLCDWKTERGEVARVPTWHAGDDGVQLLGDDVLITQATPVTSSDSTCIEFSMLTDVALDADVHLQFDVFGDGVIDYDQPIPTASWAPVSYLVSIDAPWNGITFRLVKHGGGHAVLAEIKAETRPAADCTGAAITLPPRPNGGWCHAGGECASGVCSGQSDDPAILFPAQTCAACTSDAQCTNGFVCGIDDALPSALTPFRACVPPASRVLGELCAEDAECATGVCHQTCSTCRDDAGCATGETCTPANQQFPGPNGATYYSTATYECDPGQHRRASGETCFRDDDCASSSCVGGRGVQTCIDVFGGGDGRACTTDLDCPEAGDLTHTPCVTVGIAGGTCK